MNGERFLFAIIGPTAVGKTRAGFELALRLNAEIISVDSRQVYRYLDVGTDKISLADRKIVVHHLIDVADPDQVFTAADFVKRTEDAVSRIRARGRLPLLVGGTPLYYRALEGSLLSESLPSDRALRAELEKFAEDRGTPELHARLRGADPASAARIHPNDRVRVVRALEIFELTGQPPTSIYAARKKIGGRRRLFYFGIDSPREILYRRIEQRVGEQFHAGYPEEVEWLLKQGYSPALPALRGFGYRELAAYLQGKCTFDEALLGDIRATKAFARRQMTWFRGFEPKTWYDFSEISPGTAVEDMERRITEMESKAEGKTERKTERKTEGNAPV